MCENDYKAFRGGKGYIEKITKGVSPISSYDIVESITAKLIAFVGTWQGTNVRPLENPKVAALKS